MPANVEKLFIDYQDQIRSIKLVLNDNSSERNEEYYSKEIEITNKIIENSLLFIVFYNII